MAWDVAKSLDTLLGQINAMAPGRSKASDGSIGDTAHQAQGSSSDHNPEDRPGNEPDEVDARDFTHDPGHGADMDVISERLRLSRDRRIKYVIWRNKIFSSYPVAGYPAWTWRPYSGEYHSHLHVSVNDVDDDNTAPWAIGPDREDEDMDFNQSQKLDAVFNLFPEVRLDTDAVADGKGALAAFSVPLTAWTRRVNDRLDELAARPPAPAVVLSAEQVAALAAQVAQLLGPVLVDAARQGAELAEDS